MKISIIIATFNAGKTLQDCLNSITPQLSSDVELLIIDGGSKDKTLEIIEKNKQYISYIVSERDKGIYDAWNKGIKAAKGDWVMFIGADDVLLSGAVDEYLKVINSTLDVTTYDYICAHNEYVDMNGRLLKILGEEPTWSGMRRTMVAAHVASLHSRKEIFETIGGYNLDFKICADYELLLRKKQSLKVLFIDAHIARMKMGGMSFSTKAIAEVYKIRKLHHSVSSLSNALLFLRDWIAYKMFIIRKNI